MQRGKLVATLLGKSMLNDARQGGLPAMLFRLAFWHMDLAYFGRGLLGSWPQADIGIVLWSLDHEQTTAPDSAPYEIRTPNSANDRGTVAAGRGCLSASSATFLVDKLPCTTTAPAPSFFMANAASISSSSCDLIGVDVELLRKLSQGSIALHGRKRHLRLEAQSSRHLRSRPTPRR
jgi:hypothetical protein